jgi:response regulator of citrate/malate metabolism
VDLRPDLVLLDVRLPDGDGVDVAEALPEALVVLISTLPAASEYRRITPALSLCGGALA